MTPEGKVLAAQIRYLTKLKKAGEPIHWFKVKGGPMQQVGQPDLLICFHGRLIASETKRPSGEPTKLQAYRLKQWADAGAITGCTTSVEELCALLDQVKAERAWMDHPLKEVVVRGTIDSHPPAPTADPPTAR